MSNKLYSVFQEINTWENGPVNELLGNTYDNSNPSTRRIIMYGPTQVGKTTLIMDLIGIKPEYQKYLEDILRGGAKAGNSSTSSAVVYDRWEEDCFGILFGNINSEISAEPERLDAESFTKRIEGINSLNRDSRENGLNKKGNIIYYFLPKSLFEEASEEQHLQIVDLPGFGEKNEIMRKNAEEIIDYLSGIVAGAIVVVKSDFIQRLESDYKDFIDKHHHNHLAIAVSYAIKTSAELQHACDDRDSHYLRSCKTDRDIAKKISKHYFDLIKSEGYVSFDDDLKGQIVFAVEKGDYLSKNFSHLSGVFSESRKLLKERIASIIKRTSIDACIEEFETRNKRLIEKNNILKTELSDAETSFESFRKNEPDIGKKLINLEKEKEKLENQKVKRNAAFKHMQSIVNSFENWQIITEEEAGRFWDEYWVEDKTGKKNKLHYVLSEKIKARIGDEPEECKDLYAMILSCAVESLGSFDYDEFMKPRRGVHSKRWREHAAFEGRYYTGYHLFPRTCKLIQDYRKTRNYEINHKLDAIKKEHTSLTLAKVSFNNLKNKQEQEISELKQKIGNNEELIKRNSDMRDNVKSVFIRHFRRKMLEIDERMKSEKDPEIITALFLVKGSIYSGMKPYLEEE
ncbi:MAG: hypothetical protein IJD78_06340 [Clostridia bacterium]|nr:hypothetical protein [Clostridia bacterium]